MLPESLIFALINSGERSSEKTDWRPNFVTSLDAVNYSSPSFYLIRIRLDPLGILTLHLEKRKIIELGRALTNGPIRRVTSGFDIK
jgi:hypothetical protein